jgi:hypothetical protein
LLRLENDGRAKGRIEIVRAMGIENIQLNRSDPWTEVDGERSSAKTVHPLFGDPAVRQALRLLVDRASVSMGGQALRPAISSTPRNALFQTIPIGNSISTRPTSYWIRPAGSAGPTASAPRMATG